MLSLNNVTLCCVDTCSHALAALALRRCNAVANFAKTVFITDRPDFVDPSWECHRIRPLEGMAEYSSFMTKSLNFHIETDYVLVIQYDGFIINPDVWTDEFLKYDYVGAPWPASEHTKECIVGNGGFSLRSKKLLKALQDDKITMLVGHEDGNICAYRNYLDMKYGIRFAPIEVATKFSYENDLFVEKTFGFHGLNLLVEAYHGQEAFQMIDNLQPYLLQFGKPQNMAIWFHKHQRVEELAHLIRWISRHMNYDDLMRDIKLRGASEEVQRFFANAWQQYCAVNAA